MKRPSSYTKRTRSVKTRPGYVVPTRSYKKRNSPDSLVFNLKKGMGSVAKTMPTEKFLPAFGKAMKQITMSSPGEITYGMAPDPRMKQGPKSDEIPYEGRVSKRSAGGKNGIYTSKVQKYHFVAGNLPGRTLKATVAMNGETNRKQYDSLEESTSGSSRADLSRSYGFNQRNALFISPDRFGWTKSQTLAPILGTGVYTLPVDKMQVAYAAVAKLRSKMSLTNTNTYLPQMVKLTLFKQREASDLGSGIGNYTFWPAIPTTPGAVTSGTDKYMTGVKQLTDRTSSSVGTSANIDPRGTDMWTCEGTSIIAQPVHSKTFKLSAGDSLEFCYDHMFRAGINMRDLLSATATAGWNNSPDSFFTYGLCIETWGPQVDSVNLDAVDPDALASPVQRYRGSAPGSYQLEFEKRMVGARPDSSVQTGANPASAKGWGSSSFAIKVYTDRDNDTTVISRIYNRDHSGLNVAGGYKIPVVSDASSAQAGAAGKV